MSTPANMTDAALIDALYEAEQAQRALKAHIDTIRSQITERGLEHKDQGDIARLKIGTSNVTDADNKMLREKFPEVWAVVKRTKPRTSINAEPRPDVVTANLQRDVEAERAVSTKRAA